MNAIIIDDEIACIEYIDMMCMGISDLTISATFTNAIEALSFLSDHKDIDLVFMDIEMPGLNGLEALKEMRYFLPDLGVIFVTGYNAYALEAFQADALAYLLKPCSLMELQKAIHKAVRLLTPTNRIKVYTFGDFSIYIDGEPYRFANKKANELLALLIDRKGAIVTLNQAVDILWENRPCDDNVKQLYRKAIISLHQLCKEKQLDFFVSNRGCCHIIPSKLDCDYYRLLNGDPHALREYCGKYMNEYSWAEETNGEIYHRVNQK